jgi:hypothetical protein
MNRAVGPTEPGGDTLYRRVSDARLEAPHKPPMARCPRAPGHSVGICCINLRLYQKSSPKRPQRAAKSYVKLIRG